jgi:hypothetical protein
MNPGLGRFCALLPELLNGPTRAGRILEAAFGAHRKGQSSCADFRDRCIVLSENASPTLINPSLKSQRALTAQTNFELVFSSIVQSVSINDNEEFSTTRHVRRPVA